MFISILLHAASVGSDFAAHPIQFHCFSVTNCLVRGCPSIQLVETQECIAFDSALEPFKDGVEQFIERVLSPGPGYPQLLGLLETDEYTLKKMVLNIIHI